jgi:hypothetical protein
LDVKPLTLHCDAVTAEGFPDRAEVEAKWEAVIDGRLTREEVHDWAEPFVLDERSDDVMVLAALQQLHGFDLTGERSGDPFKVTHGHLSTSGRSKRSPRSLRNGEIAASNTTQTLLPIYSAPAAPVTPLSGLTASCFFKRRVSSADWGYRGWCGAMRAGKPALR